MISVSFKLVCYCPFVRERIIENMAECKYPVLLKVTSCGVSVHYTFIVQHLFTSHAWESITPSN
jgi:hypothetical protein